MTSKRHGVTIVELLVVVAVIAIILGLLLPAISGLRASARCSRCLVNLRHLGIACQQYVNFFDAYPPAVLYDDGEPVTRAWDYVTTTMGQQFLELGPLWQYTDDPGEAMQCPEYDGGSNLGDPFTGYNYNTSFLGAEECWQPGGEGDIRPGLRPSAARFQDRCATFGDGGRAGGTNRHMRAPLAEACQDLSLTYAGGQAFRHTGATNVVYLDGHVGNHQTPHHPGLGMPAGTDWQDDVLGFPENGFLSEDNSAYDPR